MNLENMPKASLVQVVYGEIVYWITIVACIICMIGPVISLAWPEKNVLNPHFLFAGIFSGKEPAAIWEEVGGGFPGGHFYFSNFFSGDGFTQFGLALGCSVAFWALLATAIQFLRKKDFLYVILALWVALLVFLSMSGITQSSH